jgi:hypothetical protein
MIALKIAFWACLILVFYTYLGYGILLYVLLLLKRTFCKQQQEPTLPPDEQLPDVTLMICAYNEEEVIREKMENIRQIDYPQDKFWDQLSHNFSPYIGISMSVPIFTRFQTRNNIRSARLNQELQQIQLDKAKQSLYKEIQQAWSNAVAAEAKFRSSSEAATAAEDAFRLTQAKYENGKATITEFNESRNQLLKTQSDRVQATYEYLFQSKLLDFYRGSALTF